MKELKPTLRDGKVVSTGTVKRKTVFPYDHRGRKIVVILEAGDVIGMREERTRRVFTAPIRRVLQQLIVWTVDAERANKKSKKKKAYRGKL